jgi:hypothetical protein
MKKQGLNICRDTPFPIKNTRTLLTVLWCPLRTSSFVIRILYIPLILQLESDLEHFNALCELDLARWHPPHDEDSRTGSASRPKPRDHSSASRS